MAERTRIIRLGLAAGAFAVVGALAIGCISNLQPHHIRTPIHESTLFAVKLSMHLGLLTIPVMLVAAIPIWVAWMKPKIWWMACFGYGLLMGYWFLLVHLANNAPWD